MTTAEAPPPAPPLAEAVRDKLRHAAGPLKLADLAKGLPKPRKVKADEFRQQVRDAAEEEVRQGRAFRHPSGNNGEPRYWSHDEVQHLRGRAVELAAAPLELGKLAKAMGQGIDGRFAEAVVRGLVAEGRLFEHPPRTKKGKPLFCASPPPPPLATKPHLAKVEKLTADCRKLLAAAGVAAEDLLQALRLRLAEAGRFGLPSPPKLGERGTGTPTPLDELILKAVANAPVVALADLRREMPGEFRGPAFDDAVLRLADQRKVVVSQDADPASFSDAERDELVCDGGAVYTTIAARR